MDPGLVDVMIGSINDSRTFLFIKLSNKRCASSFSV